MKPNKIGSMLGLAARGRNLVSGEFATENAVKSGKAFLVIITEDASDNTVKKFTNMCDFYEVPMVRFTDKEAMGHYIGKEMRVSVAVTNEGIADTILHYLEEEKIDTEE